MMFERLEMPSEHGKLVMYPSFVRRIEAGDGGEARFDCWCPKRTHNGDLDYQQGKRHFDSSLLVSKENGNPSFLLHVAHAMADGRQYGEMERGFVEKLCSRAYVGGKPVIGQFSRLNFLTEAGRTLEELQVWDFVRMARELSTPSMLNDAAADAIKDRDSNPFHAVFLTMIAASAFNGASN